MSHIASLHPPTPTLRLVQHADPATALGLAVSHLMTRPAFARLPFGSWSRVLVGQINRKHYFLARDPAGRSVGFLGWALTTEAAAEGWLDGRDDAARADADDPAADCVIINAWSAETPAVNRLLLDAARRVGTGHRLICFKRHYPDGRGRRGKLAMPDAIRAQNPRHAHDPQVTR